jgi:tetratricopeptide (TPR) repeat protein
LNKAIEADSNFFEAKVMKIAYHYNQGFILSTKREYRIADSLRKSILPSARLSNRQRNLLQHYEALIKGDNGLIYTTLKKEYNLAPFDLYSNASTMVVAHQFVNRPQDVDTIFQKISMKGMAVANCTHCQFRYFMQASADLELKKYRQVIDLLHPVLEEVDETYLKRPVIAAYIRSYDFVGLTEFFSKQELVTSQESMTESYMFALKELLIIGNDSVATDYVSKIEAIPNIGDNAFRRAEIAYLKGDYVLAEALFNELYPDDSSNIQLLSKLAVSYNLNGKKAEAERVINELISLKSDYQFGSIDYSLAQYYAAIEDEENAYKHLLKAIIDGNRNTILKYQDDPHFKQIKDTEKFNNILTYWY